MIDLDVFDLDVFDSFMRKSPKRVPDYKHQREIGNDWKQTCNRHNMLRKLDSLNDTRVFEHENAIHEAVINKDLRRLETIRDFRGELNESNYFDYLQALMKVDEVHSAISLRRFDMFNQRLKFVYHEPKEDRPAQLSHYGVEVEGLSNGQPSLIQNDQIVMIDPATDTVEVFKIVSIIGDMLVLPKDRFEEDKEMKSLDIYFVSNGLTYEYYDKALDRARRDPFTRARIFEAEPEFIRELRAEFSLPLISINKGDNVELSEPLNRLQQRLDKLNEPQRKAVEGILAAECRPKPYIVFGPPGTGKTHTLVEAIVQIYVRKPEAKILFCANSNTCADQTEQKLKDIGLIPVCDVHRLKARDRTDGINLSRILVTTNMKSASLLGQFEYDFVFIDEAGHAHEPETLLPISSVKRFGCVVLAGDPKQLGPVVQCELAAQNGLGTSMFERVFNFRIYHKDLMSNSYNSKYITKLLYSYRCDPRILAISNRLFYENELVCCNETPETMLNIMHLKWPVQFLHVRGIADQPRFSTSWRNEMEAAKIVDLITRLYKMGLKPDQIGVITPYRLQARLIQNKLKVQLDSGLRYFLEDRFKVMVTKLEEIKKGGGGDSSSNNNNKVDQNSSAAPSDLLTISFSEMRLVEEDGKRVRKEVLVEYREVIEVEQRKDRWVCKIDSVDAFQGDEREIIIMSTVRTPCDRRTSFIDEPRRFNVALSRAKWLVFVFGHKDVLEDHENWHEFMRAAGHDEVSRWPQMGSYDNQFCGRRCQRLFKAR